MVRKTLAWAAFCFAIAVLASEIWAFGDSGHHVSLNLGDVWRTLSPASYDRTETFLVTKVSEKIWQPGLTTVLAAPVWLALAALGAGIYPWQRRSSRHPL